MLLDAHSPAPPAVLTRHDSVFALVLLLAFALATSTFFALFALPALLAGILLSLVLHHASGESAEGGRMADRLTGINFAAIHVGGDTGGLIVVLGSVAILALGLPTLRWFLIGSVIMASAVAAIRIARRT